MGLGIFESQTKVDSAAQLEGHDQFLRLCDCQRFRETIRLSRPIRGTFYYDNAYHTGNPVDLARFGGAESGNN